MTTWCARTRNSAAPSVSATPRRRRRNPLPVRCRARKTKQQALDLVVETVEDLFEERGEQEKVWGSMVKQALKRRKPGFNESYHGFRSFAKLLEEASARKLLELSTTRSQAATSSATTSTRTEPRDQPPIRAIPGSDGPFAASTSRR